MIQDFRADLPEAYMLLHDGALALARAERQGIRVDMEYCRRKRKHLKRKIDYLQRKLEDTKLYRHWRNVYGEKTNIHSNHQLAQLLYKNMKIEPPKTTRSGKGSTDEDTLRRLDVPGLDLILDIRKLNKVRTTYLGAFMREEVDGFIHPSFLLHTVRTYRSSSADPNFQNIPKRDKESMKICRKALRPRPGHMLVGADFSSLEVMIAACYHKDPTMLKYLRNPEADMHGDMAQQLFLLDELIRGEPTYDHLRYAAKNGFVFPQFYGDYFVRNARALADYADLPLEGKWGPGLGVELPSGDRASDQFMRNGISSYGQFEDYVKRVERDFWDNRFPQYRDWKERWVEDYRRNGYLQMLTGFVCTGEMKQNEIINYPIQGTAFHCLLKTLILVDEVMVEEGWDSKIIGQIHDEIVMDVHPDELGHVRETLEWAVRERLPKEWPWIIVPLDIEIEEYGVDEPWVKAS